MRWAAAAGVAIVAVGVVVGGVILADEPSLDEQLSRRVMAALERAVPTAQPAHGHGHAEPEDPTRRTDIDGNELVCVAKVFGRSPTTATTVDDVKVVYAHRACAAVGPGLIWPESLRETGPVAVRLGTPDQLVLPEKALPTKPDAAYADRIRAVIPKQYQKQALAYPNFVDPEVAANLEDQLDD